MARDAHAWHQRFDRLWRDATRSTPTDHLSSEAREISAYLQIAHRLGGPDFDVSPERLRVQAWSPDAAVALRYVVGRIVVRNVEGAIVLAFVAAALGLITAFKFLDPFIARWFAVSATAALIGAAACLYRVYRAAHHFPLQEADRKGWEFAAAWQRQKWAERSGRVGRLD